MTNILKRLTREKRLCERQLLLEPVVSSVALNKLQLKAEKQAQT